MSPLRSVKPRTISVPLLALAICLLSASCAGDGSGILVLDGGPQGPFPPRLSEIQANVLSPTCAPGCHQPGGIAPFSMQTASDSYANLVNVPNSLGVTDPTGFVYERVEPLHPARSYLILKLRGSGGIAGARMPLGQSALEGDVIDTIALWIQNGAQND